MIALQYTQEFSTLIYIFQNGYIMHLLLLNEPIKQFLQGLLENGRLIVNLAHLMPLLDW
jgi:hypothetical protein